MVRTRTVAPLDRRVMEDIGMSWHTDQDGSSYVANDLVELSEAEATAYYQAANTLYDMYVDTAQHVIDDQLYYELGIPSNLVAMIEDSWDRDDWHLYGRFDLAGGIDGQPVKLIEFNADTPTSLFETSIVQWAMLKANGMDESSQFNNLHEMLQKSFQRLIIGEDESADFSERYAGQKILFSSVRNLPEDEQTVRYLQAVATEAGFYSDFCYLDEAGFIEREGVFNVDKQLADYWFKLYPWEDIATDELELTRILEKIVLDGRTRILNPAYTLIFQSQGMLKLLCDGYPDSPYLLPADFSPLHGVKQVRKPLLGREGANTQVLDAQGRVLAETDGRYGHQKSLYQQFVDFPTDASDNYYQAGVFYAYEACALGFRRGGVILDDRSKFIAHVVV